MPYAVKRVPGFATGLRVLHVGPNERERAWIARELQPSTYHVVDIEPHAGVTLVTDVSESLPLPDASVDLAVAWHVLEHIPRDRAAIAQIHRVLRPGGTFVVSVPIHPPGRERTFEDPATPPSERERVYGFDEHVRSCGLDYVARLVEAGFDIVTIAVDREPAALIAEHGLSRNHVAWLCTKPA